MTQIFTHVFAAALLLTGVLSLARNPQMPCGQVVRRMWRAACWVSFAAFCWVVAPAVAYFIHVPGTLARVALAVMFARFIVDLARAASGKRF
jgi:hypothetical protein